MQSVASRAALVERLDRQSLQSPALYKFKLALLAGLGFLVLGGSAVVALAVSVGLVVALYLVSPVLLIKLIKIIWIPIAFGWLVLKALWVRFEAPDGYRLAPGEAPELVAEVESLRRATRAPKLEAIIITPELNAFAASVPRASGLFGHTYYLVLGLPLMQLLGREEMAAVIAHEFGHFGGGHNRFGGWIHRVRISWYRVMSALSESDAWASKPFTRFFHWYAPFFDAYSFSLARANEYEADATAAKVSGAENTGRALARVHLGSDRLEREFWPRLRQDNLRQPQPPARLYHDMAQHLRNAGDGSPEQMQEALRAGGGYDDTHPTLAQRLQALGVESLSIDRTAGPSSAEVLLGALAGTLEEHFSSQWREEVEPAWTHNHARHADARVRLEELERIEAPTPGQVVEHAHLVDELRPETDALPLFEHAVELAPDDASARFRLGNLLLMRGDASGVEHVRTAMRLDAGAIEAGSQLLMHYYASIGDVRGQTEAESALEQLYEERQRVAARRGKVSASDTLLPHGLDEEVLDAVRGQLERLDTVKRAWIVRKHVSDDPDELPHYVMLVSWRGLVFSEGGNLQRVVDAVDLPGSFMAITAPNQRRIANKVKKVAGAPAYTRTR
ncbi:M48 family metallopeptidase [Marilutibacter chinensis]|uniref:M48 family metalloprotease n=1 Tax=Marilutibacter chinensis TaxID=2912247 RepID=A0ABS9HQY0_9GAMM|nr:M48 family metallopeptidase [Lysobacter chinensis]MCF7220707.1 M48 family metalloprotease [Lysobacter chinensis]